MEVDSGVFIVPRVTHERVKSSKAQMLKCSIAQMLQGVVLSEREKRLASRFVRLIDARTAGVV